MQTFLPYADFEDSAHALDEKRLGKQRVETLQIMKALTLGVGWIHHPATKMWRGYEWSLLQYQKAVCEEWTINCGFKDTCLDKTMGLYFQWSNGHDNHSAPPWLGDEAFHYAHRANLWAKAPDYYSLEFKDVTGWVPYIWPVS